MTIAQTKETAPALDGNRAAEFNTHPEDSMAASVVLTDCPECGHELIGTLYAHCNRCKWVDTEALDASEAHQYEITKGAL